jgi:hypothetical protein
MIEELCLEDESVWARAKLDDRVVGKLKAV